jgi:3-oxoadipate enol-lactonase
MPFTEVNGQSVAYYDTGGPGEVVVLSHGFLMDHSMFDLQVAALSPELRVITWDQRGCGGTVARGPFSFWDSARDLIGLLDHLQVERAVVVGLSQGGFVALRAALLEPQRIAGLVLLATQAGLEDPRDSQPLIDSWMSAGPSTVAETLATNLLGPGDWPEWIQKWSDLPIEQLDLAYRCLIRRDDITGRLREIRCPALVLHGTADTAIPFEKSRNLLERLGGPTTVIAVPEAPHALSITHPQAVNEAIQQMARTAKREA